jgi:hypothetical protein
MWRYVAVVWDPSAGEQRRLFPCGWLDADTAMDHLGAFFTAMQQYFGDRLRCVALEEASRLAPWQQDQGPWEPVACMPTCGRAPVGAHQGHG